MEIGSVLELDDFVKYQITDKKNSFRLPFMKLDVVYNTTFYQSGRNAIEALLLFLKAEKNVNSILLPDYMCETVCGAAQRAGVTIKNYKVDRYYNYSADEIEKQVDDSTCIFVAQFFGKRIGSDTLEKIESWKKRGLIIIEDLTLSLFSTDKDKVGFGTYILGSIRKWLPIPDGGFLCSCEAVLPSATNVSVVSKYTDYYFQVQVMKKQYIDGGCVDKELKKTYLAYYNLSIKELFSDYTIYPASELSLNFINNCNFDELIKVRKDNYDYLYNKLKDIDSISLQINREDNFLPFGMLIFSEKRDELLQYLIENDIYCNVHWRLASKDTNPEIEYLANHTMTIPCDQRYSYVDLDRIVSVIKGWKL